MPRYHSFGETDHLSPLGQMVNDIVYKLDIDLDVLAGRLCISHAALRMALREYLRPMTLKTATLVLEELGMNIVLSTEWKEGKRPDADGHPLRRRSKNDQPREVPVPGAGSTN